MIRVAVTPDLVLDDEMYELARYALSWCAPEQVEGFTWERFVTRESWTLVPDVENPDIPFFKAEFVIKLAAPWQQTVKLNVWHSADVRRDGAPLPHSHPWNFRGYVLLGGYEEDRYELSGGQVEAQPGQVHLAGMVNNVPLTTFHEVRRVLVPDRTLSLMDCDLGIKNAWGYLDPDTGVYTPCIKSEVDARFKPLMLARNPHLRK